MFVGCRGGAELLFGNKKKHAVSLPAGRECEHFLSCFDSLVSEFRELSCYLLSMMTVMRHFSVSGTLASLILWMRDNMLKERPELFVQDGTV